MAMTRTETGALAGVALLHLALFGWLSLALPEPADLDRPAMAVELVAEPAAVSTAPQISSEEPAAALGEPDLPPEPAAPEPSPPDPEPAPPRPVPPPPPSPKVEPDRAQERARERERERATRAEQQRVERERQQRSERERVQRERAERDRQQRLERERTERARAEQDRRARAEADRRARADRERREREARNARGGDPLGRIESDVRTANGRSPDPPARQTAAQIRASIEVSINAEVRGPWNGCRVTGVDVDRLRTTVVFRLAQSGALERIVSVSTSGVNDSNRPQVQRFEECARRAITLAAPFNLPGENYQYWQTYTLDFEKR